jgi:hypothetical protein
MATYISPTGEYPRHIGDIQIEHPNWQKGDDLPNGWNVVLDSEIPAKADDEIVVLGEPVKKNGLWYQNWVIRKMTQAELEMRDAPITTKEKLKALGLNDAEIMALAKGLIRF